MKFDIVVKITIVALLLVSIFGVYNYLPELKVRSAIDKTCTHVDDCAFQRVECCPGCEGFESMNKNSVSNVESILQNQCANKSCPSVECTSKTGYVIRTVPVCENNYCTSKNEVNCQLVCKYLLEEKEPYMSYLENAAESKDMSIDQLADSCGCVIIENF